MNILEYENYQEKKYHGNPDFPYVTYPCSIPMDFPEVPPHWHGEMEIIYIKKGKGIVEVDFKEYDVSAGTLCFIVPGQIHSIRQKEDLSMEYENIIFDLSIVKSGPMEKLSVDYFSPLEKGRLTLPTVITADHPSYRDITSCVDGMDTICMTFPKAYELALKSGLLRLFFILFSFCSHEKRDNRHEKNMEKIRPVIKYVENHYSEELSTRDMAKKAGLSESHFMKFFKTTMGVPFLYYLNDYRLTMASRLLLSSDDSILTIASDCGYDNLSYFNRLFKRRFGMTPRDYRKVSPLMP
ncbi:MAG: AraC family transcriptional regulator [Lachnospiraceae bacterium]|nr:AraC family transcriptional regulator [Lachnospiraceae bacterium]